MSALRHDARKQRALALALLVLVLAAAAMALTAPLRTALASRADIAQRLAEYRAVLDAPVTGPAAYDPAMLTAAYADEPAAHLALQSLIDEKARAAVLNVQSLTPAGGETLTGVGRISWMEAALQGDLQGVMDFLRLLDAERPVLLVRVAQLGPVNPADPNRSLEMRLEIGRVWRAGEGVE